MPTYVYRDGRMVDKKTGEPMVVGDWKPVVPQIIPDIQPYLSPVDGSYVGGRRSRRADLDRHNCVEYEPSLSPTQGKFRTEKWARVAGKEVAEEFRDT